MHSASRNIDAGAGITASIKSIDNILIELSSLKVNYHSESGIFFHHNPNIRRDASYGEYGKDGYFNFFHPEMNVIQKKETLEDLVSNIKNIKSSANSRKTCLNV